MRRFRTSIAIIIMFAVLYVYVIFSSPLPYKVIDQDDSGVISVTEAIASLDVSTRELLKENETCTEYYWLKDGLTVYAICHPIE